MEKINSIEQLDALSAKICELFQVGIDKTNTVVPETLRQIVVRMLYQEAITSVLLIIVITVLTCMIISTCRKIVSASESDERIIMLCGIHIMIYGLLITLASLHLLTKSIPLIVDVLVAPNLVIMENLGGFIK